FYSAEVLGHYKKHHAVSWKLVVVVTDFHPVRVWAHSGVDFYWVLSDAAKKTLIERGTDADKITSGGFPILREFTQPGSKTAALKKYGLKASDRLTVLMTTGSFGLGEQAHLLELLSAYADKLQCLVVCGRNQSLFEMLSNKKYPYPVK